MSRFLQKNRKLRVLIACEESQVVTLAFRKLGFLAFSCDVIDQSGDNPDGTSRLMLCPLYGKPRSAKIEVFGI